MPPQPDTRVGLLFRPAKLKECFGLLQVLRIKKTPGGLSGYEQFKFERNDVQPLFGSLSDKLQMHLAHLCDADIAFEQSQIRKKYKGAKNGSTLDNAVHKALQRHLHGVFDGLLNEDHDGIFYHQVINPATGNQLTAPCRLHPLRPVLHFRVLRAASGALQAAGLLDFAGDVQELQTYERNGFLLRKGHDYWPLTYNDYLVLEWLDGQRQEQYATQPEVFLQRIVVRLEETHPVDRNACFDMQEIRVEPVPRLYLSEIGDSFLMLTPQFSYEGIVLDGSWKEWQELTRNGRMYRVFRDRSVEQSFVQYLQAQHDHFAKQHNGFFNLSFTDAKKKNWFLKAYHEWIDRGVEITGLDLMKHFRYSPHPPETVITHLSSGEAKVDLHVVVRFGEEPVSLGELQKLLLGGQSTTLLKDHSIGVFPEEWLERYAPLIKHGKIKGSTLTVPKWLVLGLPRYEEEAAFRPVIGKEWWQLWQQWQEPGSIIFPVPASLRAELRDYQRKGFEWMALLSHVGAGACLADDMGLGKTLQTIAFLAWRQQELPDGKYLVVCPASLLYNWQKELERFAPQLRAWVHGSGRPLQNFFDENAQVLIASYGTLRADIGQLALLQWDTVVLDESQNIKNPAAQVSKAALELKAACRVALSGTPVMNNTFDLYAQLEFLLPGMFGTQDFFRKEYANPIDRDGDKEKVQALRRVSAPFILRRTKEQVAADLPEKTESVLWCEMDAPQREAYETVRNSIRDSIFLGIRNEGLAKSKLSILQGILKLRQVCCSPQLLQDREIPVTDAVKIALLMEELKDNLRDHKVLVFSQFRDMLHLIADACRTEGIAFYHFNGETPPAKRQEMVAAFQEAGNTVPVFLISLKAGNAGLNLTAADYVFLVDPWWNTAVQQQAIDRTHRIGQTRNVFAYKMICKDTIEERILQLQQSKKALSEELVSEDEGFVKSLTEEDVAFLFE